MRFQVQSTQDGHRFRDVLRITQLCQSSTCINLCIQLLQAPMARQLKFKSALLKCILALSSALPLTGSTSTAQIQTLLHRRCCGYANSMNGRKKRKIHLNSQKLSVLTQVHLKYSFLLPRAVSSHCRVDQLRLILLIQCIQMLEIDVRAQKSMVVQFHSIHD